MNEPRRATVGELAIALLERSGVDCGFGIISIHNLPILDAIDRRKLRFVTSRTEAGALNMADAFARVTGRLGLCVTSTGTAAGNACGALVEAATAGSPVLHLTGQVETPFLDRGVGYIHEARDQLGMLAAASKGAFRVATAESALDVLRQAVRLALTAPRGPVSVEIPIDLQEAQVDWPASLDPLPIERPPIEAGALDALAEVLAKARRPILWLGGGARDAGAGVARLVKLGMGVVTSGQGRGVIPEDHPLSIGAFSVAPPVEQFFASCDAALVVGSRLRSNETRRYTLKLPTPLLRIDADPAREGQSYPSERFVRADAAEALSGLADRLAGRMAIDPAYAADLARAREAAVKKMREGLPPYEGLVDALGRLAGRDYLSVRDVTISSSTWGNRLLRLYGPRDGVHAVGVGIGQGLPMAVGAAVAQQLARRDRPVVCLLGDGGLMVSVGELATAVAEQARIVFVLMNDRGYGVLRDVQDSQYGGRRFQVDLHTPDFVRLAESIGLPATRVSSADAIEPALAAAFAARAPRLVEIDMDAIGRYKATFTGPPTGHASPAPGGTKR